MPGSRHTNTSNTNTMTTPSLSWFFNELQQQTGVSLPTLRLSGALYARARRYTAAYLSEILGWHDEDIILIVGEVCADHDTLYYSDSGYKRGYDQLLSAISGYGYRAQERAAFVPAVSGIPAVVLSVPVDVRYGRQAQMTSQDAASDMSYNDE